MARAKAQAERDFLISEREAKQEFEAEQGDLTRQTQLDIKNNAAAQGDRMMHYIM